MSFKLNKKTIIIFTISIFLAILISYVYVVFFVKNDNQKEEQVIYPTGYVESPERGKKLDYKPLEPNQKFILTNPQGITAEIYFNNPPFTFVKEADAEDDKNSLYVRNNNIISEDSINCLIQIYKPGLINELIDNKAYIKYFEDKNIYLLSEGIEGIVGENYGMNFVKSINGKEFYFVCNFSSNPDFIDKGKQTSFDIINSLRIQQLD